MEVVNDYVYNVNGNVSCWRCPSHARIPERFVFEMPRRARKSLPSFASVRGNQADAWSELSPADIKRIGSSKSLFEKARKDALAEATNLWNSGHRKVSLELLRRARNQFGNDSEFSCDYGVRALQEGHTWAARESLHDAVDLDPTNLDALELFLDLNREVPATKGSATTAIVALAENLPYGNGFDSEAIAFLVPSVAIVDKVNKIVRKLKNSEDAVARHASLLATSPKDRWDEFDQNVPQDVIAPARLTVTLANGDYDVAIPLLEDTSPGRTPKRALRMAIRRDLRQKKSRNARELLKYYRRIAPADLWARDVAAEISQTHS